MKELSRFFVAQALVMNLSSNMQAELWAKLQAVKGEKDLPDESLWSAPIRSRVRHILKGAD